MMGEEMVETTCDACGKKVSVPKSFREQYDEWDWAWSTKVCSKCQDERDLSCYSFGNLVICLPDGLI
ncbi:MAG: hypothetical protein QW540_07360 [Archaeoglobaceae archaeon]